MANTSEAIATANLKITNTMVTTDYVLVTLVTGNSAANGLTRNITLENLMAQNADAAFANLYINFGSTPANSTALANVTFGQVWTDGTYIYAGAANGVTKRVLLSSF